MAVNITWVRTVPAIKFVLVSLPLSTITSSFLRAVLVYKYRRAVPVVYSQQQTQLLTFFRPRSSRISLPTQLWFSASFFFPLPYYRKVVTKHHLQHPSLLLALLLLKATTLLSNQGLHLFHRFINWVSVQALSVQHNSDSTACIYHWGRRDIGDKVYSHSINNIMLPWRVVCCTKIT